MSIDKDQLLFYRSLNIFYTVGGAYWSDINVTYSKSIAAASEYIFEFEYINVDHCAFLCKSLCFFFFFFNVDHCAK